MNADCFIPGEGNSIDSVRAWARYALAALAGIFLAAGAAPALSGPSSDAYLLQDAIAAFTAFPLVYAKVQLKSDQPIFAQLGVIFTAGMGWQHLVYSVSPR
jgi:hypothetical protein